MAVKLRLRREGTVKRPHYRVVAADSRSPRDGRFIEIIGTYHPLENPSGISIDSGRALHWLRNGAQPTAAVEKLLRITGVWEEFRPGDAPARDRSERGERLSRKARARQAEPAEDVAPPAEPAAADEPAADEPAADEADADAAAGAEGDA